ncbi:MAG: hypothetical protein ACRC1K_23740 [Planctomycetia bacterium]
MFCSNCGTKAAGRFCHVCGAKMVDAATADEPAAPLDATLPGATLPTTADMPPPRPARVVDWENDVRYAVLLETPLVRELIAKYASEAPAGFTGEQFLELCDLAFAPVANVSVKKIATATAPLSAALGLRTGAARVETVRQAAGRSLAAVVCSLARHGRKVKSVSQRDHGCTIEAVLPSDVWTMLEGALTISVDETPAGTRVEAVAKIPGQCFDWGKSKRCVAQVFDDLRTLLPPSLRLRPAASYTRAA